MRHVALVNAILILLLLALPAPTASQEPCIDLRDDGEVERDGSAHAQCGRSVAVWGDMAAVGCADQNNGEGAVFVYEKVGGAWHPQLTIRPPLNDHGMFGRSVAMHEDLLVVGAPGSRAGKGVTHVFRYTTPVPLSPGSWEPDGPPLEAPDGSAGDQFGVSVSIHGNTVLVGAPGRSLGRGEAYIFRKDGSWYPVISLGQFVPGGLAAQDIFGAAVSIYGGVSAIGALGQDRGAFRDAGAVHVFRQDGGSWDYDQILEATDPQVAQRFGTSVSAGGETIAIGAVGDGSPTAPEAGAAYVFVRSGSEWIPQQKIIPCDRDPGAQFGRAIYLDGSSLLIGSVHDDGLQPGSGAGAAYFYGRSADQWQPIVKMVADSDDPIENQLFGYSVSLHAGEAVVGALWDSKVRYRSGAAYLFGLDPVFDWPLDPPFTITQDFNCHGCVNLGEGYGQLFHSGMDLGTSLRPSAVRASARGEIVLMTRTRDSGFTRWCNGDPMEDDIDDLTTEHNWVWFSS